MDEAAIRDIWFELFGAEAPDGTVRDIMSQPPLLEQLLRTYQASLDARTRNLTTDVEPEPDRPTFLEGIRDTIGRVLNLGEDAGDLRNPNRRRDPWDLTPRERSITEEVVDIEVSQEEARRVADEADALTADRMREAYEAVVRLQNEAMWRDRPVFNQVIVPSGSMPEVMLTGGENTPINVPMMPIVESRFVPEGQAFVLTRPPFENVVVTPTRTVDDRYNWPTLRLGSTGDDVERLQRFLRNDLGFNGVEVDGIFGQVTDSAVRTFQRRVGLTVDGIVGRRTWSRISSPSVRGIQATDLITDEYANIMDDAFIRALLRGDGVRVDTGTFAKEEIGQKPQEVSELPPEPFSISEFFKDAK